MNFILQMVSQRKRLILSGELFYLKSKFLHFRETLILPGDLRELLLNAHTASACEGRKLIVNSFAFPQTELLTVKVSL